MGLTMRPLATLFLVLLLVLSAEMGAKVGEARNCGTPSHKFRGACFSNRNCGDVCETEGFPNGSCQGFRRRCICYKPC